VDFHIQGIFFKVFIKKTIFYNLKYRLEQVSITVGNTTLPSSTFKSQNLCQDSWSHYRTVFVLRKNIQRIQVQIQGENKDLASMSSLVSNLGSAF
jgi:hypothetical protein